MPNFSPYCEINLEVHVVNVVSCTPSWAGQLFDMGRITLVTGSECQCQFIFNYLSFFPLTLIPVPAVFDAQFDDVSSSVLSE